MPPTERAGWHHPFPVRYLLTVEDEDGEDQEWGRCAGASGLFLDPVPPPREVFTLRDCAPRGPLHAAVTGAPGALPALGDLFVAAMDHTETLAYWELVDAELIAHRPAAAAAGLFDITVAAGVRAEEQWRPLPAQPHFEVQAGHLAGAPRLADCARVDGLFRPREEPPEVPLELVGCEPAEPLLAALRRPRRRPGWGELCAVDRHGRVYARHVVGLAIDAARPSVLGGTLLDVTLADGGADRPPAAARPVWAAWYDGIPTEPNQWAQFDTEGRRAWLLLGMRTGEAGPRRPDRSGGVHHLDGRFVTDVPAAHCALGEALLGPGRYYGWGLGALADCLGGGFGVQPPFTLVWHQAAVARRALAAEVLGPGTHHDYFAELLALLEERRVRVLLR
ncbi:barstar family protein [Kitasatospora sp. LaBMicrA B282]|uniref:barstar family protein n=1 Tax=Kitasatospora sp. LaBMicrA B282 TaxID=3420949 RepID=UPI003D127AD8